MSNKDADILDRFETLTKIMQDKNEESIRHLMKDYFIQKQKAKKRKVSRKNESMTNPQKKKAKNTKKSQKNVDDENYQNGEKKDTVSKLKNTTKKKKVNTPSLEQREHEYHLFIEKIAFRKWVYRLRILKYQDESNTVNDLMKPRKIIKKASKIKPNVKSTKQISSQTDTQQNDQINQHIKRHQRESLLQEIKKLKSNNNKNQNELSNGSPRKISAEKTKKVDHPEVENKFVYERTDHFRAPRRRSVDRMRRILPYFTFSHIEETRREKYDIKLLWPVNNILYPPEIEERIYNPEVLQKNYYSQKESMIRLSEPKYPPVKIHKTVEMNNDVNNKNHMSQYHNNNHEIVNYNNRTRKDNNIFDDNNEHVHNVHKKTISKKKMLDLCQRLNQKTSINEPEIFPNKNQKRNSNKMTNSRVSDLNKKKKKSMKKKGLLIQKENNKMDGVESSLNMTTKIHNSSVENYNSTQEDNDNYLENHDFNYDSNQTSHEEEIYDPATNRKTFVNYLRAISNQEKEENRDEHADSENESSSKERGYKQDSNSFSKISDQRKSQSEEEELYSKKSVHSNSNSYSNSNKSCDKINNKDSIKIGVYKEVEEEEILDERKIVEEEEVLEEEQEIISNQYKSKFSQEGKRKATTIINSNKIQDSNSSSNEELIQNYSHQNQHYSTKLRTNSTVITKNIEIPEDDLFSSSSVDQGILVGSTSSGVGPELDQDERISLSSSSV
ncbi:hypothetical protein TRFO_26533 [Tritrichomonas foetus]|uniref:Uncharacterized protein n=1 Tax=Tritrichomonas foetus TaxID=1144522 RepID=A0A1J4K883_9EUKA|nr:hypothetical protein TRFO_26533 [Tritrichomonas foetus]|eukprot:OHT05645.1 hypothetical protein TRFO_26533 [Tritrichomonas foetus]